MRYLVVYSYSWYNELFGLFLNELEAHKALFRAHRARPNHKVKLIAEQL